MLKFKFSELLVYGTFYSNSFQGRASIKVAASIPENQVPLIGISFNTYVRLYSTGSAQITMEIKKPMTYQRTNVEWSRTFL